MKKIDVFITILFLFIAVFFIRLFWQEYTRTLTKLNETPVGIITFKKRTAQRKFIDRIVWDMLKQASDIYNGDTIRTIKDSEAVISFRDETTHITMNANTLIQIFYNDINGARIEFSEGNLEVTSGSVDVTIISGSSEIIVSGQATIDKKDEGFALSVLEGEAILDGKIIEAGNLLILDEQGKINTKPAIAITSLKTSMRITSLPGISTPVVFSWNAFNFNADTYVIVETSLDPAFKHIVRTVNVAGNDTASINMESGNYFWRAYPANAGSKTPANPMYPSGTLEIVSVREIAATPFDEIEEATQKIIETPIVQNSIQKITNEPATTSIQPVAVQTAATPRLTGGEGVVASDTFDGNGNFYEVVNITMSWTDAKAEAERRGGHLATITSAEEQEFVNNLLRNCTRIYYWLGGYAIDKEWTWVTNEPFSYTNWAWRNIISSLIYNGRREDKLNIYRISPHHTDTPGMRGKWNNLDNEGRNASNPYRGFIIEYPAEAATY